MSNLWVRALLAADRLVERARVVELAFRDELLWAWLPESTRAQLTATIYDQQSSYAPGGETFARGLRSWEEQLLAHPSVPRHGRVLVGGAGGGRELRVLCERGYRVTAFDPSERLARAAATIAPSCARVLHGSYQDLDTAVHGRGSLAALRDDAPYALVLLGWRSLSHVLEETGRKNLFRALRVLAPDAPVLASFAPRMSQPGRLRRALRRTFRALGAPSSAPAGALFFSNAGFAVELDRDDLERAAAAGNYSIELFGVDPDGHAILVPR